MCLFLRDSGERGRGWREREGKEQEEVQAGK